MNEKELLDFCRVKKIFDKGFGFLTSLYYNEPVFFHFNKVKDPAAKEKLEKLKRGEVYFFYTSITHNDKRRVYKLWLDVNDIDKNLINDFIERIIEELNSGKINIFELTHVLKLFREEKLLKVEHLLKALKSIKLLRTPSAVITILSESEEEKKVKLEKLLQSYESKNLSPKQWIEEAAKIFISK